MDGKMKSRNRNNKTTKRERMEMMELKERKYSLELVEGDNYFSYTLLKDGNTIVRSEAFINGYYFDKDRTSSTRYWKKAGRGGMKQKALIEQKLIEADSKMYNLGYSFL